jgi:hypothetical protein
MLPNSLSALVPSGAPALATAIALFIILWAVANASPPIYT